jgi:glycosyltransferase involved in cell wall biosynthesis
LTTSPAESELVSVVIPAYNAEAFVGHAIESVLGQTYAHLELIVVDDGSTDGTAAVARSYADPRLRVIEKPNGGAAAARNAAIADSSGPLLAFLDADDYWYPTKLEVQVAELARRPELVAVACRVHYVSSTGRVLGAMGGAVGPKEQQAVAEGRLGPFHVSSGTLFRREAIEAAGGFDPHLTGLRPSMVEDRGLIAEVATFGPIDCVPDVLAAYRIHAGAVSARRYMAQCKGVRYIIASRSARSRGEQLSWEEFLRDDGGLAQKRRDLAGYTYRQAGLAAADRRWLAAGSQLVATTLLAPVRTFRRVRHQQPWMAWSSGRTRA